MGTSVEYVYCDSRVLLWIFCSWYSNFNGVAS